MIRHREGGAHADLRVRHGAGSVTTEDAKPFGNGFSSSLLSAGDVRQHVSGAKAGSSEDRAAPAPRREPWGVFPVGGRSAGSIPALATRRCDRFPVNRYPGLLSQVPAFSPRCRDLFTSRLSATTRGRHMDTAEALSGEKPLAEMDLTELKGTIRNLVDRNEQLEESMAQLSLAVDDIGWKPLGIDQSENEMPLDTLQKAAETCRALLTVNPLVKRGIAVR